MTDPITNLPTLEELQARGPAVPGRALTPDERERARQDRKNKPKHLETKRKSEALCKRQLLKWGAHLEKVRDDLITLGNGQEIRVSKDVDFAGSIPLRLNGSVAPYPLRVESKGITLKNGKRAVTGSFPLTNLSAKEQQYLQRNRTRGGLSMVHIAWWLDGQIWAVHIVPWIEWPGLVSILADRAKEDKRFKGKSIRYHADEQDLLKHCRVYKLAGCWTLPPDNWLKSLLVERPDLELELL